MADRKGRVEFTTVYRDEIDKEIVKRREEAGFIVPDNVDARADAVERVGLALSGGGIRSGAFNLGVLQALHQRGVLRHVDYLSTVSGGGYVGSMLSSLSLGGNRDRCESGIDGPRPGSRAGLSLLEEKADGQQSTGVKRLLRGGMYLKKPRRFLSRYLVGWLAVNLVLVSVLLCGASLFAFLFRCLDFRIVIHLLYALGVQGDICRALFPSMVVFCLWIAAWGWCYLRALYTGRSKHSPCTTGLFTAFLVTLALAIAALLGTGDIYVMDLVSLVGIDPSSLDLTSTQNAFTVVLVIALVVGLTPYLRPAALIRSATRPKNSFESLVFSVASYAVLYGIPLLFFGIIARENISGYNESREKYGNLSILHISNDQWKDFLERVKSDHQAVASGSNGRTDSGKEAARRELSYIIWEVTNPNHDGLGDTILELEKERRERERDWWFFQFCWNFTEAFNARIQLDECRARFVERLNRGYLQKAGTRVSHLITERLSEDPQAIGLWDHAKLAADALDWARSNPEDDLKDELRELSLANWAILQFLYGDHVIRDPSTVFAYVVTTWDGEQQTRFWAFVIGLGASLIFGLIVNLNETSIHNFYRDRLAEMWIRAPSRGNHRPDRAEDPIPLCRLRTTARGLPYHLINCTQNFFGESPAGDDQGATLFSLSKRYCGSGDSDYVRTSRYMGGKYDLANAMAVSGAAVSPAVFANPLLMIILLAMNFRLGQWLQDPGNKRRSNRGFGRWRYLWPAPLPVAVDQWLRKPGNRRYALVTDGGHHENLGIEALLKRRCRVIIASDVGVDPEYRFESLLKLVRRSRVYQGIRFWGIGKDRERLVLDELRPDIESDFSRSHFVVARVSYPEETPYLGPGEEIPEAYLIYLKSSVTGDESVELLQYRNNNPTFPHDSTLDQFYDENRFESYRQLGHHAAVQMCEALFPGDGMHSSRPVVAKWLPPQLRPARKRRSPEDRVPSQRP